MVALGAAMAALAWRAPHQEDAFGAVPWRGLALVVAPRWSCSASPCAGWGSCRCWWWWSSPPPGPAATPASRPRLPWPWASPLLLGPVHQGAGPALAAGRPLAEPAPTGRRRATAARSAAARRRPPPPRPSKEQRPWNCSSNLGLGFATALALEPALRLRRLPARHRRRRAAGPGAARHHRHAPAARPSRCRRSRP